MYLRKLKLKDAPLMLSWMHDENVTKNMNTDFSSKNLKDAESFIRKSWRDRDSVNLAIASSDDEYMGTVSLKHIENGSAEFAIAIRSEAMGRGYSWFGMESIVEKAFNELGLDSVYWCVSENNARAVRFYDKHHFHVAKDIPIRIIEHYKNAENLRWYSVLKGDEFNTPESVSGCKVVHVTTIPTINAGELSFFEGTHDVPFEIKRIYYISKVPEGVRRGYHAHKKLKQLLFCPFGCIQLVLDNGDVREEIELSDPSIGVLIDSCVWREMIWLQKDSVLCVAASEYYEPDDYIRSYDEFKRYLSEQVG